MKKLAELSPEQIDALWRKFIRGRKPLDGGHIGWNGTWNGGQRLLIVGSVRVEVRQFLWFHRGREFRPGMYVRPHCGVAECIKPMHLHMTDMRAANQKLGKDERAHIVRSIRAGTEQRTSAAAMGVSQARISQILKAERGSENG